MNSKVLTQIIICITVAAAILVPSLTLFNWGDYLYCSFDAPANRKMMIEVLILAVLIGMISFLVRQRKTRLILLGALALVFSYIHSMLLPVAVAGIYFIAVASIGNLVTGTAAVIITAGMLSLFGWCTPLKLGIAVLIIAILYTIYRILYRKDKWLICELPQETSKWQLLINAVVLLVALVQIGRATVAVRDFDSLWYGLRSEHVLAPGGNIFENLGLAGMVYTYSKGYEILTLPLNAFKSYAYIPVFNTGLFLAGLNITYSIVESLSGHFALSQVSAGDEKSPMTEIPTGRAGKAAGMAVIITAVIPGIVNMCVSAKPDIVTWLLQLILIERFFRFVRADNGRIRLKLFFEMLAAYLLSLTMKPTAVIFSTALAGMMLVWWIADIIIDKNKKYGNEGAHVGAQCSATAPAISATASVTSATASATPATASVTSATASAISATASIISAIAAFISLCIVWGRTIKLTGVPFTSVFTGLLTVLGFNLKYPFASSSIPTRFKGDSVVKLVGKRAARMLLSPEGNDMGHVSIAWGGSIMLVLGAVIIICIILLIAAPAMGDSGSGVSPATNQGQSTKIPVAAALIFIPYAIVCAVTLAMLSQVDGNYYMTLYSVVTITAMWLACEAAMRILNSEERIPAAITIAATVMIAFQFFIVLLTNWASAAGFTPIAFNKLYYDNENDNRVVMTSKAPPEMITAGNTIYDMLAAQPQARVLAIGEHPFVLQFRCVTQSYGDMANPWGNPQLEDSTEEFLDYLHFAGIDYIYVDGEYIGRDECEWRRGMIEDLDARGLLYDYMYEGDNYLVRVK